MTTKRSSIRNFTLNLILVLICYFPASSLFAQYYEENITVFTFPDDISVIANVPVRQHALVADVNIDKPGYYRIFPKIIYAADQTNESFYLTVLFPADPESGTRQISYPTDTNAGNYRVVENFPADTLLFRNAGLFFFDQGINDSVDLLLKHY